MGQALKETDTYEHIEEEEKALESFLTPLVNINGCKAAVIMTSSDGNQALVRMKLDKTVPLIADFLV